MEPVFMTKKFLLAGVESQIDFGSDFSGTLNDLRNQVKQNLHQIKDLKHPVRMIGFWQPDGVYFAGVEVLRIETGIDHFVVKDLPESLFACFRENKRGTIGSPDGYAYKEWFPASGYWVNEDLPGDFEIFDDAEHCGDNDTCTICIPIQPKRK